MAKACPACQQLTLLGEASMNQDQQATDTATHPHRQGGTERRPTMKDHQGSIISATQLPNICALANRRRLLDHHKEHIKTI